ncbi:pyridoxamine 5'-phosphate oxidase family protein [Halorussus salilacus]|uniref:pyridoxamine 5'-phosphate oxidase family protein n=1 Tax=Halorussus salilacus TaxID=2953750 RepID=UPI00209E9F2C|nr:pyridoxamine 5'-phosphate oxidase family protein [Halorussus salilacus]USZ67218.1 pyridoxamine 5'-phosphate oxidase family protein [Halorussus salilacus]
MEGLRWVQLSEGEMNEFLGTGGTGILSFSTESGDPPFSVPVSYGYDTDGEAFYFRLALPPESGKTALLDNPVTFATHERTDDGWRSVVASGRLTEVSDMPYDATVVQAMWAVDIPEVDIFDRPPEDIDFRHFRLDPQRLTGRKEVKHDS